MTAKLQRGQQATTGESSTVDLRTSSNRRSSWRPAARRGSCPTTTRALAPEVARPPNYPLRIASATDHRTRTRLIAPSRTTSPKPQASSARSTNYRRQSRTTTTRHTDLHHVPGAGRARVTARGRCVADVLRGEGEPSALLRCMDRSSQPVAAASHGWSRGEDSAHAPPDAWTSPRRTTASGAGGERLIAVPSFLVVVHQARSEGRWLCA